MIDFSFNPNDIPDYAKSIGDAYDEAYEECHIKHDRYDKFEKR